MSPGRTERKKERRKPDSGMERSVIPLLPGRKKLSERLMSEYGRNF